MSNATVRGNFSQERFLIVDDFHGMRVMIREMLRNCGGQHLDFANNGNEAVNNMRRVQYDVVLCDFNLGQGKNGQQVLEEAKHLGLLGPGAVWVMVSAEKTMEMVIGAVEVQPDDYLIKPITEMTLQHRLKKLIQKRRDLFDIEAARRKKDFTKALSLLDLKLQINPSMAPELLRLRAQLLLEAGRYDKAQELLESILASRDLAWAKTALAKACFFQANYETALRLLSEVIAEHKTYLEAYDWLAKTLEQMGNLQQAQQILLKSSKLSPNSISRQRVLGEVSQSMGDLSTAERAFRKSVNLGENTILKAPGSYLGLAKVLSAQDQTQEALKILGSAKAEFDSPDIQLQTRLSEGLIHVQAGNFEVANRIANEIGTMLENGEIPAPALCMEAAQLLISTGNKDVGMNLLQTVVKNNHDNQKVLDNVQRVFDAIDMGDEGKQLVEQTRQEAVHTMNKGVKLAYEGKLDEAVDWMRNAKDLMPNNPRILLNYTHILVTYMSRNGKNEGLLREANDCLDRAIQLDPDDRRADELKAKLIDVTRQPRR